MTKTADTGQEKMDVPDIVDPMTDADLDSDDDLVLGVPVNSVSQFFAVEQEGQGQTDRRREFLKDPPGATEDGPKRKRIKNKKPITISDPPASKPTASTPLAPNPPAPIPVLPNTPIPLTPLIPDPVVSSPTLNHSRPRQYQEGSQNDWVVFFRPKQKPLNFLRISQDLEKNYSGVLSCTKLNKSKLRVVVNNAKQANQIVTDIRFCVEYRVWIPAHKVEIDGVVTEEGLTAHVLSKAVGRFKNPKLPPIEILEVRQMGNITAEGANRKFVPTASFRVTFAGSALPDYVELYKLRLPVRLYTPRVMCCTNCQQLGHTMACCSNKSKCSKCSGAHKSEECKKQVEKCLLCGGEPHKTRDCPKVKDREAKMKKTLKERSKKSFAEILKKANTSLDSANRYVILSDGESDVEDKEEEILFQREEDSDSQSGPTPKRKKTSKNSSRKAASGNTTDGDSAWYFLEQQPSASSSYEKDFPAGPSGKKQRKSKPSPKTVPESTPPVDAFKGLISFSQIVEWLCSCVSEPISLLIKQFAPLARTIGKQLAIKSTLLSIISFDD